VNDGRPTFQSLGSGKLYDVLIKVYGLEVAQQMLEVRSTEADGLKPGTSNLEPIDVQGYISSPSLHRANRGYLTFFVNGRWVQDRMLSYAVSEAYHTLLPTRRYPIVVLRLGLDSSQVDINVHPTKSEVRFLDSSAVFTAVQKAVRRTLVDQAAIPRMTDLPSQWPASDMDRRRRLVGAGTQAELALEAQRTAGIEAPSAFEFPELAKLPPLRVLGQAAQTYIIAEGPEGLYLIDQHTAHERVLYERLMAERAKMAVASQSLLEPLTIELPFQAGGAGGESLELLNQLGFDIEPFGGETYLVRAAPTMLAQGDIGQAIVEIIDGLTEGEAAGAGEERALISLVCHSAVRAGKTLSQEEMRDLIRQLEETAMPRTCPHGRPTMIHLSAAQLAREFGR